MEPARAVRISRPRVAKVKGNIPMFVLTIDRLTPRQKMAAVYLFFPLSLTYRTLQ